MRLSHIRLSLGDRTQEVGDRRIQIQILDVGC